MSLKTKGFSRETEALIWIGGGENRTLVLGKLRIDHYMLSVLKKPSPDAERTTKTSLSHLSRNEYLETSKLIPYQVIDDRL
jgi:hypothetical protein